MPPGGFLREARYCGWTVTVRSTVVVCVCSERPLFSVTDFSASLRLPDCGLKKVSRRNTNEKRKRNPKRKSVSRKKKKIGFSTAKMQPTSL